MAFVVIHVPCSFVLRINRHFSVLPTLNKCVLSQNSKPVCLKKKKKPYKIWGLVLLTDLFNKNAWQCHPTTPGSRRAAGVLEVGATGELAGRHAPTRQGGSGEQGMLVGCKNVSRLFQSATSQEQPFLVIRLGIIGPNSSPPPFFLSSSFYFFI